MPSQIVAPTPIAPGRSLSFASSHELFASLSATLASKGTSITKPSIPVDDYSIPPPPPPSPVHFKKWHASPLRR